MILVQFYSITAQKNVTISKHRKLEVAIKAARNYYIDGYNMVSIKLSNGTVLNRYGKLI